MMSKHIKFNVDRLFPQWTVLEPGDTFDISQCGHTSEYFFDPETSLFTDTIYFVVATYKIEQLTFCPRTYVILSERYGLQEVFL